MTRVYNLGGGARYVWDARGIQIRFSSVPAEQIRAALKFQGFYWNRVARCWDFRAGSTSPKWNGKAEFLNWLEKRLEAVAA